MEAYRIGIVVSLTNRVSSALGLISRDFRRTEADAAALNWTLRDIKVLGLTGGAAFGAGFLGLDLLSKTLGPAREYAHQLNMLREAGLSQVEVAQAIGDAWKNTGTVITTTATQNLRALLDLRNIVVSKEREFAITHGGLPPEGSAGRLAMERADWTAARTALPYITRMQAALQSADERLFGKGGAGQDFAWAAAKALDIRGAVQDPDRFKNELELMGQVGIWSQNRITPKMFQSVIFYARQAQMAMSADFLFGPVAALMLESANGGQGGGARGIGPAIAAAYRAVVQGYGINKKTVPLLHELGLIGPRAAVHTTTQGTTVGPMLGSDLFQKDQFEWATTVLKPRLEGYLKRHNMAVSQENENALIGQITRGNQLYGWVLGQYIGKEANIRRDIELRKKAMTPEQAYQQALKNDPEIAFAAASAQWKNLATVIGNELIPIIIPALQKFAGGLHDLAAWGRANPDVMHGLVVGFAGLSASLMFGGSVLLLTAAFKGLRAILTVGGLVPATFRAATGLSQIGMATTTIAAAGAAVAILSGVAGALSVIAGMKALDWVAHRFGLPTADEAAKDYGKHATEDRTPPWLKWAELPQWLDPNAPAKPAMPPVVTVASIMGWGRGTPDNGSGAIPFPPHRDVITQAGPPLGFVPKTMVPAPERRPVREIVPGLRPRAAPSGSAESPHIAPIMGWGRGDGRGTPVTVDKPVALDKDTVTALASKIADGIGAAFARIGLKVEMDAREVGKLVAEQIARVHDGPHSSPQGFDPTMNFVAP